MRFAVVLVAGLSLAGCAGSPVGDAMAGPEKLAARDDATCQSYGARPGTDAYVACRMNVANQRQAEHQARYANAQRSFDNLSRIGEQQQAQTPPPIVMQPAPQTIIVQPRQPSLSDTLGSYQRQRGY